MIPEVSTPTPRCSHPEVWSCHDAMATEIEVLDMLTALVWMLKPKVIAETGCYFGHGTEKLALGALHNGFGHVYTCDIDHSMTVRAAERLQYSLKELVTIEQCSGTELIAKLAEPVDFAFLDSGGTPSVRGDELRAVMPKLSPWGVVAIHDTGPTHPDLREQIFGVVEELGLESVTFDTPRGFTICRRKYTL